MKLKLKSLNSKGFSHIEIFTAVLVIVGIAFAGVYVNDHRPNKSHAATIGYAYVGATGNATIYACRYNNVVYSEVAETIGKNPKTTTFDMFDEVSPYSTLHWIAISSNWYAAHIINLAVNNYLAWSWNGAHISGFTRGLALQQCAGPQTPILD